MDRGMGSGLGPRSPTQRTATTGPSVWLSFLTKITVLTFTQLTFQVRGPNGSQTVRMGGSNTLGGENSPQQHSPVPNMSS